MKTHYKVDLGPGVQPAAANLVHRRAGRWHIAAIWVPPAHRGRGHGAALLERICEDADYYGVTLTAQPADTRAGGWFMRHGFYHGGHGNTGTYIRVAE